MTDTTQLFPFDVRCVDCGMETESSILTDDTVEPVPGRWEYYWVKEEVWAAAGMPHDLGGALCVGCIEARLGRRLRPRDFDFTRSENLYPDSWATPRLVSRRGRR